MNKTVKYIVRSLKFFVFCIVMLCIFIVILAAIMPEYSLATVFSPEAEGGMFQDGSFPKILAMFLAFSFLYPALTYVKKEVLIEGTFEEHRDTIIDQFSQLGYVLDSEDEEKAIFRQRSGLRRLLRIYEDKVSITKGESPLILNGNRKELLRLSGLISFAVEQKSTIKDDPYDFSSSDSDEANDSYEANEANEANDSYEANEANEANDSYEANDSDEANGTNGTKN